MSSRTVNRWRIFSADPIPSCLSHSPALRRRCARLNELSRNPWCKTGFDERELLNRFARNLERYREYCPLCLGLKAADQAVFVVMCRRVLLIRLRRLLLVRVSTVCVTAGRFLDGRADATIRVTIMQQEVQPLATQRGEEVGCQRTGNRKLSDHRGHDYLPRSPRVLDPTKANTLILDSSDSIVKLSSQDLENCLRKLFPFSLRRLRICEGFWFIVANDNRTRL